MYKENSRLKWLCLHGSCFEHGYLCLHDLYASSILVNEKWVLSKIIVFAQIVF